MTETPAEIKPQAVTCDRCRADVTDKVRFVVGQWLKVTAQYPGGRIVERMNEIKAHTLCQDCYLTIITKTKKQNKTLAQTG